MTNIMKHHILLIVIALIMGIAMRVEAKPVDKISSANLATRILNKAVLDVTPEQFTGCYLYVGADGKGFVLLAADDRVRPVLAYSMNGEWPMESDNQASVQLPAHVAAWINGYQREMASVIEAGAAPSEKVKEEWKRWETAVSQGKNTTSVAPLLTSRWSQNPPYNNHCPYDAASSSHAVTGCVATAMSQVMRYWQWPEVGYSSHSYTWSSYGTISANFDSTYYHWDLMPDTLSFANSSEEIDAVATLMYHAGVAVEMMYSPNGSGAYSFSTGELDFPSAENALKTYFRYNPMLVSHHKGEYSDTEWDAMMRAELDAGRPVLYGAAEPYMRSGHAFVIDGYDNMGMFHVNWGWGGRLDAWYTIDSLAPGAGSLGGTPYYRFTGTADALFEVYPYTNPSNTPSTVSLVSNNTSLGTVTGSGVYQPYDTVNVEAQAAEGCRYLRMASGNHNIPFSFLALGQDYIDTAIFERITGNVVGYCYDTYAEDQPYSEAGVLEWGIRIPAVMRQGEKLSAVQLYYLAPGDHTVSIYEGENLDGANPVYIKNFTLSGGQQGWRTLELDSALTFDPDQTIWITICYVATSVWDSPVAASTYCGNPDGSWYRFSSSCTSWGIYHPIGGYYTWMLRAVLGDNVGVNDIDEEPIRVYSRDGRIVVEGSAEKIQVFDMAGRNLRNESLPTGVYLVKVGNHSVRKVMVVR